MEEIVEVEETRCTEVKEEEQRGAGERNGALRSGGREKQSWERIEPYLRNSSYKGDLGI